MRDLDPIKAAEEIAGLLYKEMYGELSLSERQRLTDWRSRQDATTKKFFEDIMDREQIEKDLQLFDSFNPKKALADVWRRLKKEEESYWRKLVNRPEAIFAGCVIGLILVIGLGYIYHLRHAGKNNLDDWAVKVQIVVGSTITPGGNKAVQPCKLDP